MGGTRAPCAIVAPPPPSPPIGRGGRFFFFFLFFLFRKKPIRITYPATKFSKCVWMRGAAGRELRCRSKPRGTVDRSRARVRTISTTQCRFNSISQRLNLPQPSPATAASQQASRPPHLPARLRNFEAVCLARASACAAVTSAEGLPWLDTFSGVCWVTDRNGSLAPVGDLAKPAGLTRTARQLSSLQIASRVVSAKKDCDGPDYREATYGCNSSVIRPSERPDACPNCGARARGSASGTARAARARTLFICKF
eukprot:SAG31_NODE_56_length_29726_cov_41.443312_7_plen_254_part_00